MGKLHLYNARQKKIVGKREYKRSFSCKQYIALNVGQKADYICSGKKYSRVRESVCKKEKTHQESKWYHIAWVSKNNTHDEILTFAAPGLLSLESRAFRRDTLTHTKRTALYTDMFCYCYQQQLIHNHQMQNKCLTLFRSTEKSRTKKETSTDLYCWNMEHNLVSKN